MTSKHTVQKSPCPPDLRTQSKRCWLRILIYKTPADQIAMICPIRARRSGTDSIDALELSSAWRKRRCGGEFRVASKALQTVNSIHVTSSRRLSARRLTNRLRDAVVAGVGAPVGGATIDRTTLALLRRAPPSGSSTPAYNRRPRTHTSLPAPKIMPSLLVSSIQISRFGRTRKTRAIPMRIISRLAASRQVDRVDQLAIATKGGPVWVRTNRGKCAISG